MFKKFLSTFLLIIVSTSLVLLSCADDDDTGGGKVPTTKPNTVLTTTPITTPPTTIPVVKVKSITPTGDGVNIHIPIRIVFSGDLDKSSTEEGTIELEGNPIDPDNIKINGDTITISPHNLDNSDKIWPITTRYNVIKIRDFRTTYGDQYGSRAKYIEEYQNYDYWFKTGDNDDPALLKIDSIEPDYDSPDVDIGVQIKIRLSLDLDRTQIGNVSLGDITFTSDDITISGNEIIVDTNSSLEYGRTYSGLDIWDFKTEAGEPVLIEEPDYSFTTKIEGSTTPTTSPTTPTTGSTTQSTTGTTTSSPTTSQTTSPMPTSSTTTTTYPPGTSYNPLDESGWGSASYKLGANYSSNGNDVEFAVYSKNGTKVQLEIYLKAYGEAAHRTFDMKKNSDNIWRAKLSNVPVGTLYGYRVWGPNWPYQSGWTKGSGTGFISDVDSNGNRFNPNKLLFDPYTREISHDRNNIESSGQSNGSQYGTGPSNRNYDTGNFAPKSVVVKDTATGGFGSRPGFAEKDSIIYETHVRGLTKHPSTANLASILNDVGISGASNIPENERGTYKGATYMIPYFKSLGINTVSFMPVHETDNDHNPPDKNGGNFWGYMTYGFFAPDRRYSSDKSYGGPTREFKEMVKAFHEAGIKVYLDVVYNHSGEGGVWDGTGNVAELTFFRGLDNDEYYALTSDKKFYWQTTGCGNNMRCDNPPVRQLILDSLTYWIDSMGIDGFRFDLAVVLGREKGTNDKGELAWNWNRNAKTLTDIAALGASKNAAMVAEAWDIGGYGVGQFPNGWADWNGKFRDEARLFLKSGSSNGGSQELLTILYGSKDFGYPSPAKTVNFMVAHDGFTLADLFSYSVGGEIWENGVKVKGYNEEIPWPFGPSDGGENNNKSWNHEIGSTQIGGIGTQAFRRQQMRNAFTLLMLSRGVPMMVYGDEFGRTQNGNNNPYNIDSVATWNNYEQIKSSSPQKVATGGGGTYHDNLGTGGGSGNPIFEYARKIINLKKNSSTFNVDSYGGMEWHPNASNKEVVGVIISGSSGRYLMLINGNFDSSHNFTLPASSQGWTRIADTGNWAENVGNFWATGGQSFSGGAGCLVGQKAIVVFKEGGGGVPVDPNTPTTIPSTTPTTIPSGGGDNQVTLTITKELLPGSSVYFAGNFVESNAWAKAVRGTWSNGHIWTATVTLNGSVSSLAWKPIIIYPDSAEIYTFSGGTGEVTWKPGEDIKGTPNGGTWQ